MAETAAVLGEETDLTPEAPFLDGLLPALQRLDGLLERAVAAVQATYGPAAADPFRGLHIGPAEVGQLLAQPPGGSFLFTEDLPSEEVLADPTGVAWRLAWLAQAFGLAPFDLDLVIIALAPEIDRRYDRLYAYLQDHVARRQPSVELALNLLCPSLEVKLARRAHFAATAPLIRHGLIHLIPDADQINPPLLAHYLKLDEQIVDLLLGQGGLDRRLAPFCQLIQPALTLDDLSLDAGLKHELATLITQASLTPKPLWLYFHGPAGVGKCQAAEALAGIVNAPLLTANLDRMRAPADLEQTLQLLFREAWFLGAVLYLDGLDTWRSEQPAAYRRCLETLAESYGLTILSGAEPWIPTQRGPTGVISVSFPMPDAAQRRICWQSSLAAWEFVFDGPALDDLASRFRLTPAQIADAAATAANYARCSPDQPSDPSTSLRTDPPTFQPSNSSPLPALFAAARAQSGHDLAALAHKIEPVYTWADIVLPDDTLAQLRELCQRVARQERVLGAWGFGRKLSQGKGATALFAGPSGTGKTMAAEIIANELGLDLYKIDLAGVVSKYIGETEKNLDRIFRAAENANAVLFFDEADALFGKRSEVRDSHDRYANIEISYLLQKMEQYEGIAVLATNLRQHLDEAFMRRLAFTIHFPFPDEADRRRIWAGIWPPTVPLAGDLDLDFMARQFKLSGGNIKNIALAAAFLAAGEDRTSPNAGNGHGGPVTMAHLRHATRREYQKLGKAMTEAELGVTS